MRARSPAWLGCLGVALVLGAGPAVAGWLFTRLPLPGKVAAGLAVVAVIAVGQVRSVRRSGRTVRDAVSGRRANARRCVDTPAKARAAAPLGAGGLAVCSWPAVILALQAVSPGRPGVVIPPAGDAWFQLWIVLAAVIAGVMGIDWWFGRRATVRALASDWCAAVMVMVTVAVASLPALLALGQVRMAAAWYLTIAAGFAVPFGLLITGALVTTRRRRRLGMLPPTPADREWRADDPVGGDTDVVLLSAGPRPFRVSRILRVLGNLDFPATVQLIDSAPAPVLSQVSRARADRARDLLEQAGATVSIRTAGSAAEG
jgi:Ribosomal protein L7/L12 C-terminal domain